MRIQLSSQIKSRIFVPLAAWKLRYVCPLSHDFYNRLKEYYMRKLSNPWVKIHDYKCFGCAPQNDCGLKMEFYQDTDEVLSVVRLDPKYQGWIDTLHGGIQSVMLDEICAWASIRHTGSTGVTMSMETHFRKSVHTTDRYVVLRAKVVEERRNILTLVATLSDCEGNICSEAKCVYYMFPPDKARSMGFEQCELYGEDLSLEQVVALYE